MAASVREDKQEAFLEGTPFDLAAAQTGKSKSRVPEILVGTFLVALFALGGAWFYSTSTRSVNYLALQQPVQRGEIIEFNDLVTFQVATDAPINATSNLDADSIVGKVALVDLEAGSLITASQLADKAQIPAGQGIVGMDLSPGEFPTFSLRPGDVVRVIITPDNLGELGAETTIFVVDEEVEVVEVDGDGRDRFISLVMDEELADLVSVADSNDRVRLIQVPGS